MVNPARFPAGLFLYKKEPPHKVRRSRYFAEWLYYLIRLKGNVHTHSNDYGVFSIGIVIRYSLGKSRRQVG
jgi:hypothetical protein